VLEEPDGDRIGLLAGRARCRPDAYAVTGWFGAQSLGEQVIRQAPQLIVFAVEVGLVDGEGIDELLDLVARIGAQAVKITREGWGARSGHALPNAPLD